MPNPQGGFFIALSGKRCPQAVLSNQREREQSENALSAPRRAAQSATHVLNHRRTQIAPG
jgi:hypothetical protein